MRMTHVSSGLTSTQAFTSTGSAAAAALAAVAAEAIGRCMPMASPPPAAAVPMTNLRRDGLAILVMARSSGLRLRRHRLRGLMHGRADALVSAAAADVGHRLVDVVVARVGVLGEKR